MLIEGDADISGRVYLLVCGIREGRSVYQMWVAALCTEEVQIEAMNHRRSCEQSLDVREGGFHRSERHCLAMRYDLARSLDFNLFNLKLLFFKGSLPVFRIG